jgi:hypothetical protein
MCRKCRTIKSEKEVKKCTITYEKIKKEVEKIGYKLLSAKEYFEKQSYPSQVKLKVSCKRNHIHNIS